MNNLMIVSPLFPPDKDVGVVRMASLVRYLLCRDYKLYLLTNEKNDKFEIISDKIEYFVIETDLADSGYRVFESNKAKYESKIRDILKNIDIQMVIVSMGPFYTCGIPSICKKKHIPVITDFRDPWVFDFREKTGYNIKDAVSFALKIYLERKCVHSSDYIVTVTPGWIKEFKKYYPVQKEKFLLIENGYDDELLKAIKFDNTKKKSDKSIIGVFGKLFYYSIEYSNIFLLSVRNYLEDVCVFQVGEREDITDQLLEKNNINKEFIQSTGFLPYAEGMCQVNQADIFLIIDNRPYALGTKLFDYIFLGKPILYVGSRNSALAEIVNGLENGYVCTNAREIEEALSMLRQAPVFGHGYAPQYARSACNKKWLKLIEKAKK